MIQSSKYKAFISYSHTDRHLAYKLHRALEKYRVPRALIGEETEVGIVPARVSPIFRDRDDLPVAGELGKELKKAMANSEFLIAIASRASAKSRWVNEEVRYYKELHGETKVLVVIADGEPGTEDENECLALALRRLVTSKGEITNDVAEPLAADLRPNGDGKQLVRLKLIAGLTGLPLDTLVKREAVRKQRKLIGYAVITTLVAICMGIMASLAIRGQIEAERQRAESDGLVEFMLTDLRMQLEPVGRLEIFESVGKRALAYYARQNINALDADSLGRRARALHLVGEVRDLQADTDGALDAFAQANQTTAELLARDPINTSRIYDHSQSTFWVGYIAWQRGEIETAERYFISYNKLASQLVEVEPENTEWLAEKSSSLVNLGVMMHDNRRYQEARTYFSQALEIDTNLATAKPHNRETKWTIAQGHAWLADTQLAMGDYNAAMAQRQKELGIYATIFAIDERDARAREGKVSANIQIATINTFNGQYQAALISSAKAIIDIKDLLNQDPSNSLWQDMQVSAMNKHVEALMLFGKWEDAKQFNQYSLTNAQLMVEADRTVVSRITNGLMEARWMQIAIGFVLEDHATARNAIERFHQDFGSDPLTGKQSAPTPWSMVLAMEALDAQQIKNDEKVLQVVASLQAMNPSEARAISVFQYMENALSTSLLPADRAAQARSIAYNPALILSVEKGN